jgi:hypothetical protein
MVTQQDLQLLVNASLSAGYTLEINDLRLLNWNAGIETHIPLQLPRGFAAVYIFKWNDSYLKVGKVNSKSNARYQSQHYNPDSSLSNLSKSLLKEPEFEALIGDMTPGKWLKENTSRFNIIIPSHLGKNFVHFVEAFFILKCNPRFENTRA